MTATNFESKIIIFEKSFTYYRNMSAALALAGLETLNKMLDGVKGSVVDTEHMFAIWNDWKGRDGRARIERTYGHGRWDIQRRLLGIPNGRWYCCLKQGKAKRKGIPLD